VEIIITIIIIINIITNIIDLLANDKLTWILFCIQELSEFQYSIRYYSQKRYDENLINCDEICESSAEDKQIGSSYKQTRRGLKFTYF
jgi:hypothetical protein